MSTVYESVAVDVDELVDEAKRQAARRALLDELVTESDALLDALERRNLAERPKIGKPVARVLGRFVARVLDALPATMAEVSGLRGVAVAQGTHVSTALDTVYLAQEHLFNLRDSRRAELIAGDPCRWPEAATEAAADA